VSLQAFDLRHLKEAGKINWVRMLTSIAGISSHGRARPLKIILSDYQTTRARNDIFDYLEKKQPNIEVVFE
jgi:hypothetical protein